MRTRFVMIVAFGILLFGAACAQAEDYLWFSPLNAIIVPPGSNQPNLIQIAPGKNGTLASNGTYLEITTNSQISSKNPRWINIPLTLPNGRIIKDVTLYYQISSMSPGATYIAEVRLANMTYPKKVTLPFDKVTALKSTSPAYALLATGTGITVSGTINLELRVVFDSLADSISIGGIKVGLQ
jgi:hypothetical protein